MTFWICSWYREHQHSKFHSVLFLLKCHLSQHPCRSFHSQLVVEYMWITSRTMSSLIAIIVMIFIPSFKFIRGQNSWFILCSPGKAILALIWSHPLVLSKQWSRTSTMSCIEFTHVNSDSVKESAIGKFTENTKRNLGDWTSKML